MMPLGRDVIEVDALVTDRYLDSLLASRDLAPGAGQGVAQGIRLAAERLTRDLPRFHPSFRFEERLARWLAEAAAAMRLPAAVGAEGEVRVVSVAPPEMPAGFDPLIDPREDGDLAPFSRPLLLGGAVAASALSLAGAAFVAWRRSRTGGSPMARAARAAHAMRGRPV